MEQRIRFVSLAQSGRFEILGLCRDFGISRKTGYKWIGRYRQDGSEALKDQSRAPKRVPSRTDVEVEVEAMERSVVLLTPSIQRKCIPDLPPEADGRQSDLRRGWYWGSQAFAESLIAAGEPVLKRTRNRNYRAVVPMARPKPCACSGKDSAPATRNPRTSPHYPDAIPAR
jgi:transposase-like protein